MKLSEKIKLANDEGFYTLFKFMYPVESIGILLGNG